VNAADDKSTKPLQSISRRQFLNGDFRGTESVLRPPWSVDEAQFLTLCTACEACIEHCPTTILIKSRAGYPEVDFQNGECTFCGKCVEHCDTGALQRSAKPNETAWDLKAAIGEDCLTHQAVVCRSCGEQCESQAIVFHYRVGRVPQAVIDITQCNGCGACYSVCPVKVIRVRTTDAS